MPSLRQEFMSNSTLVSGLREILESEVWLEAKKVLAAEGPLKKREAGIDPNRALGRIEGFDDYESKLASLAVYLSPRDVLNDAVVETEEHAGIY